MNDDSFFSKKGQRKVSSFVGQELLYDYMTGQLDEERQKAVQDFIRLNKEAQMDMQKIQNGLSYAEKISQTKVSEALIERVSLPTNYTQVLMQKIRFEEWSPAFRMGLEATIVALGIMVVAVLIPWHKLMDLKIGSKDIILTEVDKNYVGWRQPKPRSASVADFWKGDLCNFEWLPKWPQSLCAHQEERKRKTERSIGHPLRS